jgi:NAD(P)-dependent dehydrogenase (short-subunit alcohol dehydrogenase family)
VTDGPRLPGRTALVTGASRGIGRAVARRLAGEGARVWALARSGDALAELAGGYAPTHGRSSGGGPEAPSGRIEPVVCDLTDDAAVWHVLDELTERAGGPPEIVVNSAGVFGIRPLAEETVKAFDAHLQVNVRAPFLVIRALLPAMLERGDGIIVNMGSVAGYKAFPGNGAYSASKFGLRGLHEVLVEELRGTGVRATIVEPSATDTELWDPLAPDDDPDLPDRADMLGADDVADAVLFAVTRPDGVSVPVLRVERG